MFLRKNEVRFTKLRKTYEISIPFSEKLSRRRRIINLDLYFEGTFTLQHPFCCGKALLDVTIVFQDVPVHLRENQH